MAALILDTPPFTGLAWPTQSQGLTEEVMRRILLAGAMAVGLLALPASSAGAATTIGHSGASSDCSGPNYGYVQDSPPASIPSDGVITSFTGSSQVAASRWSCLFSRPSQARRTTWSQRVVLPYSPRRGWRTSRPG